jgi:hypothetical protein
MASHGGHLMALIDEKSGQILSDKACTPCEKDFHGVWFLRCAFPLMAAAEDSVRTI